jgi:hypothetical protein
MKLKLIYNEGPSNEFDVYLTPTNDSLGRFQIEPDDVLEFQVEEGNGLQVKPEFSTGYFFESGSI